jgi:hypothetical protein
MILSDPIAAAARDTLFQSGDEIDRFFTASTGATFIDWFNHHLAGNPNWVNRRLGATPEVRDRFIRIWDQIPAIFATHSITLVQFSALQCILTNEVGLNLEPLSEAVGRRGYPGLAYPFSTIRGVKQTYNSAPLNKLAGDLFFADDGFWEAHHSKPLAAQVRNHPELRAVWDGTKYPVTVFPTGLDPALTGFVQEADFFKFRGRGFVQATWRANYKEIITWVQRYNGSQPTVAQFAERWNGRDPDLIATQSANSDWDELFQDSDLVVACAAIGLHDRSSGNYLTLAHDAETLSLAEDRPGTLFRMGHRISGSIVYARMFQSRVIELLTMLNHLGPSPVLKPIRTRPQRSINSGLS